ncbi:Microcin C ABC transporter ATP-binding protein YejF [Pseudomonas amygdali pv. photiniae]|uniref:Microcin C ABC transporter ATP-binding protein YejF n=1 Tax=Pseudomonas amygdali pv. photiniae TaxID=251724 RepID=A0A658K5I0_PSEA0|nr:Microcin C ABC transporter ATP-binding protein YejF [Pseudomonas amygdali pv. photiniae]
MLDEPTSALDRTVQRQVVELLRSLQAKYNLTYLFISHDLAVVKALSHQLMVVKQGQVVEQGAAQDIFAAPQHPYTQQLLEAAFLAPVAVD